jgi:hypothetical protein
MLNINLQALEGYAERNCFTVYTNYFPAPFFFSGKLPEFNPCSYITPRTISV